MQSTGWYLGTCQYLMRNPLSWGTWYTPYHGVHGTPLITGYMVYPLSRGIYCTLLPGVYNMHNTRDEGVGVAHNIVSPENQPHFSQTTMGQYWLCKTKPKQAFRLTLKGCCRILKSLFNSIFYLTNWCKWQQYYVPLMQNVWAHQTILFPKRLTN